MGSWQEDIIAAVGSAEDKREATGLLLHLAAKTVREVPSLGRSSGAVPLINQASHFFYFPDVLRPVVAPEPLPEPVATSPVIEDVPPVEVATPKVATKRTKKA